MTAPTRNKNSARAATKPTEKSVDEAVESPETVDTDERAGRARRRRPVDDTSASTRAASDEDAGARRRSGSRRAAGTDAESSADRRSRRGTRSRAASGADPDGGAEPTRSRAGRSRATRSDVDGVSAGSRSDVEGAAVGSRRSRSRGSDGAEVDGVSGSRAGRSRRSSGAEVSVGSRGTRSRGSGVDGLSTGSGSARSRAATGTARVSVTIGEPEVPVRTHGGVADPALAATVDAPPKPSRTPSIDRPERVTGPSRPRTAAAERAYARRAHRDGHGSVARAKVSDEEVASGRASFVVLIMALLAVGVAATLWLTTQAVADSYRLERAKEEANRLAEHAAQLQREVTKKESASVLAERARQLGMVPAGDPARIVVGPDGAVTVVGEAKPVQAPPPPASPADPAAGTQPPPAAVAQPPAAGAPPAGGTQPPPAGGTQQPPAAGAPPAGATPPAAGQTAPDGAEVPAPGGG
ncbi:hypothetical protein [Actinokineospora xionganensis]|uniref:Cell division protein FtsL n=1 Tax=Actinokineospora xionganensis TaxID=2684470 RepID=A0ABR7L4S4_9PSEU|nr:hypothetical protein [Actinokineospora xionganensis]MBC6447690.1 hypothetical protein [Actinokineospora xionganensis]